jgi:hypothetical protein
MQGLLEVLESLPESGDRQDRSFLSQAFAPGAAGKLPGVFMLRQSLHGTGHYLPRIFNNPIIQYQYIRYNTGRSLSEKSQLYFYVNIIYPDDNYRDSRVKPKSRQTGCSPYIAGNTFSNFIAGASVVEPESLRQVFFKPGQERRGVL